VDRAGGARAGLPAVRDGPDRAAPGHPGHQRRPAAQQRPAAVDHRHLRVHGRGVPDHHGHPRRPHRPPPAAAWRRRRLRGRLRARRPVDQPRDADRRPRAAGGRRGDPGAVHAVADLQHVPRPPAALHRHRRLDHQLLGRRRDRPAGGWGAAGAPLVGLGVFAGGAGDGAAAGAGAARAPRVPRPGAGRLDLASAAVLLVAVLAVSSASPRPPRTGPPGWPAPPSLAGWWSAGGSRAGSLAWPTR
jgi:hypothetical protein